MKKLTLFLVATLFSALSFAAQPKRIYAYNLSATSSGEVYTFSFTANETPTSGRILFYDATTGDFVGEKALTDAKLGENQVQISQYDLPGSHDQQLNWAIELTAEKVTQFEAVYTGSKKYGRGHATIDNSPESDYFGRVYVTDRRTSNNKSGLYVYTPDLQLINNTVYALGRDESGYARPAVAADGTLFLADYTDARRSGIWVVNPSDLTTCTQFYNGTRDSNGLFTNAAGKEIGSSTSGVGIYGSGANTVLYTMMEDGTNASSAVCYHIGQPDGSILKTWSDVPTWICTAYASINPSTNNAFAATEKGVWVSQNDGTTGRKELAFIDNTGVLQYSIDKGKCEGAGLAVNSDNSKLFICGSTSILEYDVVWDGKTPALTLKQTHTISDRYVSTLSLDYAGNLLACTGASYSGTDSDVMRLIQYTIPTDDNTCEVPAKKASLVTKKWKTTPRAWAYDLKVTENGDKYEFTFKATAAGSATLLFADIDGNPVAPTSHDVGPVAVGANTVLVAKASFTENKDVYWSVKMDGEAIPAISEITDQSRGIYDFYNMMGVVVDNNTDSKDFGKIYVQMSREGTTQGKAQTPGLFLFDQKLDGLNSNPNVGIQPSLPAGYTIGGDRNKFHRLNINPNTGDLVYSYNIASSPAVFAIDRENMAGNVTNLVEGVAGLTHTNAHCFDENGTLYVMDNASYPNTGAIYKIVDGVAKQFVANANWANASITMASDGRGGLWVSQNRGQMDTYYQLAHIASTGAIDWYVNSSNPQGFEGSSARGALAYDVERQILAQGRNGKVELYTVSYEPTITLTPLHTIADANIGTNIDGLAFDYAGDLYVVNSSKEKFQKFTLPTDENICTVPAPSSQKLVLGTQCEVIVTVNDPAMGSVEGAGQYEKGAEVTLTPNPVAHHRFVNWTGDMTSTDNPLKFTIEGDVNLIANFEPIPQVTITVTSNDEDMGTVTGGGTYDEGQEVTIAATPKATYRFVKWSDDVTDATRTFPAAELTLQAIFEKVPNRAWAYDLSQVADGDNYKFSFVATTAGEATLLFADKDGNELVAPYAVGTVAAGANTVTLAKTTFEGVTKDVYWSVKMDGEAIPAVAEITDQAKGIYDFYSMRGVVVDNDPNSTDFGKIYVEMSLNGANDGSSERTKTQTAGIFIYDQQLNELNTPSNKGYKPTMPSGYTELGTAAEAMKRLVINPTNGNLAFGNNISGQGSVWSVSRDNLIGTATNIIEGATGIDKVNAICYDEDGSLYVLANINLGSAKYNLYKFTDGVQTELTLGGEKIFVDPEVAMASDGRGGIWIAQNRSGIGDYKILSHVNVAEDKLDFVVETGKDYSDWFGGNCYRAAVAYNPNTNVLAVQGINKVSLFSVSYDAAGVPSITKLVQTPTVGKNIDGLAFDYAGDLYVVNSSAEKLFKFTIPTAENICTVPAPASQKLVLGTQCEVTVNVNDPAMGSVEGAGQYEKGAEVTLTPNPVAHHRFVNWTGDMTSTDNPLKFTIEGDVNLTANFEAIPTYTITTSVNDSDMGTVTPGGTYYEDTEVTLTATAKGGYVFVDWSDGNTDETRTFTAGVDMPETLTANFKVAVPRAWAYDLRLDADTDPTNYIFTFTATSAGTATIFFTDEEGTSVAPTQEVVGTVAAGETKTVTIAKSAFTGVKDIYWSVKVEGDAIAKMAELTDPTEGIYNFYVPQGVAVDNSPNSMYFGRIYVAEGTTGANDGDSEMAKQMTAGLFVYNQALEKVQPATGYTGIIPQNVTFNTNKPTSTDEINIIRQQMHRVAVDPVTGEVAFAYYKSPATAIYSMNPDDLAGNAQNLIEGSSITYANSLCFDSEGTLYVMNNANTGLTGGQIYKVQDGEVTLFAAHDKNNQWAVYDNAMASDGHGGLWIAQNRYAYDYPILSHVNKDGVVDFAVTENLNDWFPNNNTGSSYRGQCAYNLNENILAFAGNKMVTLFTVEYDGNGKPTINKLMSTPLLGGGNIDGVAFDYAGDLYVASASAERLYKFVVPTNTNTCTVPAPESQVIQKETRYTVTVAVNDNAMGTATGGGEYVEGETATLEATPAAHHKFVNWTYGSETSTNNPLELIVEGNITVTANFEPVQYTLIAPTNDENKGTVTGAGTYNYGTEVTLTATPAAGYKLLYWSDRSTENPRTITMTKNEAISAYFVKEYTEEPTFKIEKVWENTQVPGSADGYQAVGWDGNIYMQNKTAGKIKVYTNDTDAAVDYATSNTSGQQIAVDEAGNLIVFNAYFASATPNAIQIYQKGSTTAKAINFTLPNPGRCDFLSASGDIYSAEGGYVYFYCNTQTVVNRVKITNGAVTASDVTIDVVGSNISTANSTSHIMVDIFGNLLAHARSNNNLYAINVLTDDSKLFVLPSHKYSTLGGCSFELGGKELWAYNVGTTHYNSEWNLYNMTDKVFMSNETLYAKDKVSKKELGSSNWLNVQVVDENTAYIYQFCPEVAVAVWKVTCTTEKTVTIDENADNTTALESYDGEVVTATVTRSFGPNKYLTLTLPFDMNDTQIRNVFGNATVYALYNVVEYNAEEVHLQFSPVSTITAGTPYILATAAGGYDAEDGFTIEGVEIDLFLKPVTSGAVTMVPVLDAGGTLNQSDEYFLSNNYLYCAGPNPREIMGLRAYFKSASPLPIRARVVFQDNAATSIPMVEAQSENQVRKVLKDGQLLIIRGEEMYNIQGQRME